MDEKFIYPIRKTYARKLKFSNCLSAIENEEESEVELSNFSQTNKNLLPHVNEEWQN